MGRRAKIRPKKPVYLGCEGKSEVAYGQLINDLLDTCGLAFFIRTDGLSPAGDPLTRVERAVQRIIELERNRGTFYLKAILMDSDQTAHNPERGLWAKQLARQKNINLIWQKPCHEALLLRHMPSCSTLKPPTCPNAKRDLKAKWPEYDKPMPRARLVKRISLDAIRQAAEVEPDLRVFLEDIDLLP